MGRCPLYRQLAQAPPWCPHGGVARSRCATRRPATGWRRSAARTVAGPALPRSATGAPPRAVPPARPPRMRRTARVHIGAPACRGAAARVRAAAPRSGVPRSQFRRRRLVHDPPNFHGVLDEGDHLGRDLDRPFLAHVDDPVAAQPFLAPAQLPSARPPATFLKPTC